MHGFFPVFSDGVDGLVAEDFFAEAVEGAADLPLAAIGFHNLTPFPFPGGGLISPFVSLQRREGGLWQSGERFFEIFLRTRKYAYPLVRIGVRGK